jgi:hypothetical protein
LEILHFSVFFSVLLLSHNPNSVPSIAFSNNLNLPEVMLHYIHKTRSRTALQLRSENQRGQRSLKVGLSLCLNIIYEGIWNSEVKGKGKAIPGLHSLSIMP